MDEWGSGRANRRVMMLHQRFRSAALFTRLRSRSTSALVSLADQGVVSGFSFLTGIATARMLDIEAFGRFALAMIVVSLAQSVHNALVTAPMMTIMGRRPREQSTYDLSLVVWATILSLAGGLIGLAILGVLFSWRGEPSCTGFLIASGAVTAAQNLQFTLRRLLFARTSGLKALGMDGARALAFPIAALMYHFGGGPITVTALLWLLAGTALVTTLPMLRPLWDGRRGGLHLVTVARRHVPLARWLLPVVIVTFGQEQVVWIIAGGVLGDQATGGLRAAQYVVGLVLLFLSATENIIPVRAGRALTGGGHKGLRRYLISTGALLGALVLVLLLAIAVPAPLLLKLMFGPAFVPYATCLRILTLAVAFIFLRDMAAQYFRATQQTGAIFRAFTASLCVSMVVLHPLLAHFGLVGATLVVLIGHATSMIYLLATALGLGGKLRRTLRPLAVLLLPLRSRRGAPRPRGG